jgi:hypothetical protein
MRDCAHSRFVYLGGRSPMQDRSQDGSRACGNAYNNLLKHLGSKDHWKHFRRHAYNLPFDETSWTEYTMGNQYGPARAPHTHEAVAREARSGNRR